LLEVKAIGHIIRSRVSRFDRVQSKRHFAELHQAHMRMKRLRDSPLGVRTDHQAPDPRPMPSTDFHNSFESSPSHKPFPPANLTPTVSTLPRSFESLTSYPLQALTIVLPYHLNSTLQPGLPRSSQSLCMSVTGPRWRGTRRTSLPFLTSLPYYFHTSHSLSPFPATLPRIRL